jgi:hypothetical protein
MAAPADIPFADIEARVREDARLVMSASVTTDKINQFIRDAYKDIIDKRPDGRIREDGTIMPHYLESSVTTLYGEMIEFILSYVCYVKFRIRSMNKMEPNQNKAAQSDWREYMMTLGYHVPEPTTQGQ